MSNFLLIKICLLRKGAQTQGVGVLSIHLDLGCWGEVALSPRGLDSGATRAHCSVLPLRARRVQEAQTWLTAPPSSTGALSAH